MPVWAWVLIGLVLVLVIGCVGLIAAAGLFVNKVATTFSSVGVDILNSFEPLTVSTLFYTSLESKQYDSAHALLSTDLASKYSTADLQAKWEALEAAQGTVSAVPVTTGGGISSTSNTASIDEQLTSTNGKSYKVTVQLGKTGNDWRITGATPDLIPSP